MNRLIVAALVVGIVLSQFNCQQGCQCVEIGLTSGSGFNSIGNLGVGGLGGLNGLGGINGLNSLNGLGGLSGNSLSSIGVGNSIGGGISSGLNNNFGGINSGLIGIGSGLNTGFTGGSNSFGGINTGLSTNLNQFNVGLGGLNTGLSGINSGLGGLTTNIGSLDLTGSGSGLNSAGFGGIGLNTPAVLTTPSLTGNVFSPSITSTPTPSIIQTSSSSIIPSTPIIATPVVSSASSPAIIGLKVKDADGSIIHVNGYNSQRTTQSMNLKYDIGRLRLFNSNNLNYDTIVRNTLNSNQVLHQNQYIRSSNKAYYLVLQGDGNLVLFCSRVFITKNAIWSTRTMDKGTVNKRKLTISKSGSLILYSDDNGQKIWQSRTSSPHSPYRLIVQDDGNLVLYGSGSQVIWASNTRRG